MGSCSRILIGSRRRRYRSHEHNGKRGSPRSSAAIRRGLFRPLWLLAAILTFPAVGVLAAEGKLEPESPLVTAQRQADLGLLKNAAAILEQHLATLGPEPSIQSSYSRLAALLTDVYRRSGHYSQAAKVAEECRQWLQRQRAALPTDESQNQWHAITALLVRTYMASSHQQAEQIVSEELRADRSSTKPLFRLELLVLSAELAEREHVASDAKQVAKKRWKEVEKAGRAVLTSLEGRADSELLPDAVRWHARCLVALDRHQEAVGQLQKLAEQRNPNEQLRRDLWVEIAAIQRRAGVHEEEAQAWQEALKFHAARAKAGQPKEPLQGVQLLSDEADDRAHWAQALRKAGRLKEAAEQFHQSEQAYQEALRSLPLVPHGESEPSEAGARRAAVLKGLIEAAEQEGASQGKEQAELASTILRYGGELHKLLETFLLDGDPRTHRLEVTLGIQGIRAGEFSTARAYLDTAYSFFRACQPPDPLRAARVANLLSEVERTDGSVSKARARLDEAENSYHRAAFPEEALRLAIRLNRGRLAAADGNCFQAGRCFDEVIEFGKNQPPPDDELRCLAMLNKGILYKSLARFDWAETWCKRALESRRSQLPADHPDLLPYYVALTTVQIEGGHRDAASKIVEKAVRMGDQWRLQNTLFGARVQHLRALICFLSFQGTGNSTDADTAVRLWGQLEELQSQKHWRLDQAQTLHFLSRVNFVSGAARWNRHGRHARRIRKCGPSTSDRKNSTTSIWTITLLRRSNTTRTCATTIRPMAPPPSARSFDALQTRYSKLSQEKQALTSANEGLRGDCERLANVRKELEKTCQLGLLTKAHELASRALAILAPYEVHPNLCFAALCNRAEIRHAQAVDDPVLRRQAIEDLRTAVHLVERPRLAASGREGERSEFLAHYTTAFDLLVTLLVEDHRYPEALRYAELCHNRTFLDQLIRTDNVSLSDDPQHGSLARPLNEDEVDVVIRRWLDSAELLLYYYVGETDSFVFLAGIGHGELKLFRLRPSEPGLSPQAAFSARSVERCVGHYLDSLKSKDFDVELDQHGNRLVASTDTLVPPEVRRLPSTDSRVDACSPDDCRRRRTVSTSL